jgi:hypothetical protein
MISYKLLYSGHTLVNKQTQEDDMKEWGGTHNEVVVFAVCFSQHFISLYW